DLAGIERRWMADDLDEHGEGEGGDEDLGDRHRTDRPAATSPQDREDRRAERDPDQEHPQDQREDVRRVSGPRRQEPRPEHLVAQRRQSRDKSDREGQGGPRDTDGGSSGRGTTDL